MEINFLGPASPALEDILEWSLLWAGVVLFILGLSGSVIIIFSGRKIISDNVLQASFTFVSIYMLFLGLFLIKYRKKIVVRPKIR